MKAIELQRFGAESLTITERPEPRPGPKEVLMKVKAVALNFRDLLLVRGVLRPDQSLPLIPVSDGVGEIIELGKDVTRFQVGERVAGTFVQEWLAGDLQPGMMNSTLGSPRTGMLQEYVALPEQGVVRVPEHLTDEQAATLPIAGVTAWHALISERRVKPGDTVLVQGTGGVALFALQFACLAGARVIVTSSSEEKLARVGQLGASVCIHTQVTPEWDQQVLDLTDGQGVDHIIDVGGTATLARSLCAIRSGGQISVIGVLGGMHAGIDLPLMQDKNVRLQGIQTGSRAMFEAMNQAITLHGLIPIVGQVFPFEETHLAFRTLLQESIFGKICIRL